MKIIFATECVMTKLGMHGYPAKYLSSGQIVHFSESVSVSGCRNFLLSVSVSDQGHFYYLCLYPASKMLTDTDILKKKFF